MHLHWDVSRLLVVEPLYVEVKEPYLWAHSLGPLWWQRSPMYSLHLMLTQHSSLSALFKKFFVCMCMHLCVP